MGITKTGAVFKGLTIGGVSSKDYGVYISGEGAFNAPERAVEMISIPGRNGAYPLDKGHFENIEVTYPAGLFGMSEADFADAISDFRNFLCSKNGYVRIEDDYNPNEYRMGIYKSGLEVEASALDAGEFNIVFDCKPQRFLKSGETAVAVASGGKVTNPTLFDAKPQLQVWGYGDITIGNNNPISIIQADVGNVVIFTETSMSGATTYYYPEFDMLINGDSFEVKGSFTFRFTNSINGFSSYNTVTSSNCSNRQLNQFNNGTILRGVADIDTLSCVRGTNASITATWQPTYKINGITYTPTISAVLSYTASPERISISVSYSGSAGSTSKEYLSKLYDINAYSTRQATGNPLYIDLDIGEAWNEDGGSPVSANSAVTIPAELPTLPSGETTITYDNTITQFKVLPRWWKV